MCNIITPAACTGKWEGVHAFAVRIRDDNLQAVPGVRIRVSSHSCLPVLNNYHPLQEYSGCFLSHAQLQSSTADAKLSIHFIQDLTFADSRLHVLFIPVDRTWGPSRA
jgi:hypothetical protein